MAQNGKSGYTGKVGLESTQVIQAPINGKTTKAPKVTKGGDLRSK